MLVENMITLKAIFSKLRPCGLPPFPSRRLIFRYSTIVLKIDETNHIIVL